MLLIVCKGLVWFASSNSACIHSRNGWMYVYTEKMGMLDSTWLVNDNFQVQEALPNHDMYVQEITIEKNVC